MGDNEHKWGCPKIVVPINQPSSYHHLWTNPSESVHRSTQLFYDAGALPTFTYKLAYKMTENVGKYAVDEVSGVV